KAIPRLPPLAVFYWVMQSLMPWLILLKGEWKLLLLWTVAEGLPLLKFRWVVKSKRILRYLPLLLIYRYFQGLWMTWLYFSNKKIWWRGREY
ncbi:MAG: hypothetical protein RMJ66_07505, partial [Bacteroidia bacterium]|nr:hypothetical protein [Bacteroidia bacterium]MDW8134900.1 hypothetical protein [Bacteroidia bacterium]